ncbi:asparagine synthase-related protein [Cognatiluteimonas profundi]|uniref:asparagine synthase-related protein n=1 Tax=Cognatiluteimonas profundi TaxID=2594501 RepID=UPI00131E790F|nr:asparagine synthase-related protein [Lysobacter profundi]
MQIQLSPYHGRPDFTGIEASSSGDIDAVSVADILRNAFVYPPHSILENVKLASFGFDAGQDMRAGPEFRFAFREADMQPERDVPSSGELVKTYHRLLCEAIQASTADMRTPWLLQSGGKDSTSLAIAMADARPDATCLTYLGGSEENEIESASAVARTLGLRHEVVVCDPGRCYDRYLAVMHRMPLLTADFALLSYIDMATEIAARGGDGIVDGLGSDIYFGMPAPARKRLLTMLAKDERWPRHLVELPLIGDNFKLCFLLGTLQMNSRERYFPGSRFSDDEVDALMGRDIARASRERMAPFEKELSSATSADELRAMMLCITEAGAGFAKGLYTGNALSLPIAYPYCDRRLREWVARDLPRNQRVDVSGRRNKILVRQHIGAHFGELTYVVQKKGSFRFDLVGLARERFDQVHAFAHEARDMVPGAAAWLERNRRRMGNKFHASRFYLLAVVLPWLARPDHAAGHGHERAMGPAHRVGMTDAVPGEKGAWVA